MSILYFPHCSYWGWSVRKFLELCVNEFEIPVRINKICGVHTIDLSLDLA